MPARRAPEDGGRDQERFARAVDSGVRETAREALERDLVIAGMVRQAGDTLRPSPAARDRMRERISRTIEEPTAAPASAPPPGHRRSVASDTRGRLAVAAAAALCLLMSLSGMSLLLSRDALPGDALYGVKRSAESAELGLTFGDEPRALKHLEFADARVQEIELLTAQAESARLWGGEPEPYLTALDDFDTAVVTATRLLTTVASQDGADRLEALQRWAEQQSLRLEELRAALPADARARVDASLELLETITARIDELEARLRCLTITSGASDELGPLPSDEVCVLGPVAGTGASGKLSPASTPTPPPPPGLLPAPAGPGPPVSAGEPPTVADTDPRPGTPGSQGGLPTLPGETDPANPGAPNSPQAPPPVLLPLPLPLPPPTVPPVVPGVPGFQLGS